MKAFLFFSLLLIAPLTGLEQDISQTISDIQMGCKQPKQGPPGTPFTPSYGSFYSMGEINRPVPGEGFFFLGQTLPTPDGVVGGSFTHSSTNILNSDQFIFLQSGDYLINFGLAPIAPRFFESGGVEVRIALSVNGVTVSATKTRYAVDTVVITGSVTSLLDMITGSIILRLQAGDVLRLINDGTLPNIITNNDVNELSVFINITKLSS